MFEEDLTEKEVAVEESGLMQKVMAGIDNFFNKKQSIRSQASTEDNSIAESYVGR